jgi:hypothetical protein
MAHTRVRSARVPRINERFFHEWTPASAYVLGCLAADGCVHEEKGVASRVSMHVKVSDIQWLRNIASLMDSTHTIRESCTYRVRAGAERVPNACRFVFRSRSILQRLTEIGLTARKSHTLEWPVGLPTALEASFVRGYFDGDGCITRMNRNVAVDFIGSQRFIEALRDVIQRQVFAHATTTTTGYFYEVPSKNAETPSIYHIRYAGNQSPLAVLDWMYAGTEHDARLRLERKHERYAAFRRDGLAAAWLHVPKCAKHVESARKTCAKKQQQQQEQQHAALDGDTNAVVAQSHTCDITRDTNAAKPSSAVVSAVRRLLAHVARLVTLSKISSAHERQQKVHHQQQDAPQPMTRKRKRTFYS